MTRLEGRRDPARISEAQLIYYLVAGEATLAIARAAGLHDRLAARI